jgi:hypothetical protein
MDAAIGFGLLVMVSCLVAPSIPFIGFRPRA